VPIGTVSFEPTKVSRATVFPVLLCRNATHMGDDKLEVDWGRTIDVSGYST